MPESMKNTCKLIFLCVSFAAGLSLSLQSQIQLQAPELALSLISSDSTRSKEFYLNCLGLSYKGSQSLTGLTIFLFGSGQATHCVQQNWATLASARHQL